MATETVFADGDRLRVLSAGPGGGKSTLLRRHLALASSHWLNRADDAERGGSGDGGQGLTAVPVLIRATSLVGAPLLPRVLARAVTEELGPYGLRAELPEEFFGRHPLPGIPWLVMVDGLDEVPDHASRLDLLERLAREAVQKPLVYRFVVATRPLPEGELDRLGPDAARFELQPFTAADVRTYAQRWFRDLPDTGGHVRQFTAHLQRTGLISLARIPLMASMLCQLYAADPTKPLPDGRTGAYQAFVEMLYAQNTHKHVARTHEEAIRQLKDRHQIPRDNRAAEQAAQQVRDHLPELIDHLAHERIKGDSSPALRILASYLAAQFDVRRPTRLREPHWNAFLGDLLRSTGLLVQRAGHFDFPHQTLLEYHAARHATRDERARAQLVHDLFPFLRADFKARVFEGWKLHRMSSSYLGFLLDGLFAAGDHTARDIIRVLERLGTRGGRLACSFLVEQVRLQTNLPSGNTAALLVRFAENTNLHADHRLAAAEALAQVEGHREEGIALLVSYATQGRNRLRAALALARLHDPRSATLLTAIVDDTTLNAQTRATAIRTLAEIVREPAADQLADFARRATLSDTHRILAARFLAEIDGRRDDGTTLLMRFANDTGMPRDSRITAAQALAVLADPRAAAPLVDIANDPTLKADQRTRAARKLTTLPRYREEGARLLSALANDATLPQAHRISAAWSLAKVPGYREESTELLAALADDGTLKAVYRVLAARTLALLGDERAAAPLAALVNTPSLEYDHGMDSAWDLAKYVSRELGADLLAAIAGDTALDAPTRAKAARTLAEVGDARTARLLTAAIRTPAQHDPHLVKGIWCLSNLGNSAAEQLAQLAGDTALAGEFRIQAARGLTQISDERAPALLAAIARDTGVDPYDRGAAAERLAQLGDDESTAVLATLAADTSLDGSIALSAVQTLVNGAGRRELKAECLAEFAVDARLGGAIRLASARGLARLGDPRAPDLLAAIARDADLNGEHRVVAAWVMAKVNGYRHLEEGTRLLARLARCCGDTTLHTDGRVPAARALALLGDKRAPALRAALPKESAFDSHALVWVAHGLIIEGNTEEGASLLAALADDATQNADTRAEAARFLVRAAEHRRGSHGYGGTGHKQKGIESLAAIAGDTGLDDKARLKAARALADLEGHYEAGSFVRTNERAAQLLAALADDPTVNDDTRTWATRLRATFASRRMRWTSTVQDPSEPA
ncbi:hypothetical protein ACFWNT_44070 [Streptomyces sp. NPDC058409]|uniref:hypothetical protein n=1 Tax=Streptomyces sp. NPDC058409 TaxID=3346484 RepID=UPI00364C780F